MYRITQGLLLVTAILYTQSGAASDSRQQGGEPSHSISIMTYNVENLFDTEHDEGKADYEFLPSTHPEKRTGCEESNLNGGGFLDKCLKRNWSKRAFENKIEALRDVILRTYPNGPDILVMPEVENLNVLEKLNKALGLNYHIAFVDGGSGFDRRGIDSAIFSHFKIIGKPKLHSVAKEIKLAQNLGSEEKVQTRGLLEVTLEHPTGQKITVFGIHFPSPRHPFIEREAAFKKLTKLAKRKSSQGHIVIAAGDFNHTALEEAGIKQSYSGKYRRKSKGLDFFAKQASQNWHVSNIVQPKLNLPGTAFFKSRGKDKTYEWSYLDAIMHFKSKRKKAQINKDSIRVIAYPGLNQNELHRYPKDRRNRKRYRRKKDAGFVGRPTRLFKNGVGGVSDHFPMVLDLNLLR